MRSSRYYSIDASKIVLRQKWMTMEVAALQSAYYLYIYVCVRVYIHGRDDKTADSSEWHVESVA